MGNSEKAAVTWFYAFKVLSRGRSPAIGGYPGWKSSILNIAVVAPIAIVFVGGNQIRMVSGATPPEVSVIKAVGTFVQVTHGQASYVSFVTDGGHAYNMERGTTIRYDINLPQGNSSPKVYVEGFIRENGQGYFWPTMIKMSDGKIILSSKKSMENYAERARKVYRLTLFNVFLDVALLVISFNFISVTRRRLILGE